MIKRLFTCLAIVFLLTSGKMVAIPGVSTAWATDNPDFTGQWYGAGYHYILNNGANVGVYFDQDNDYAIVHIPPFGLSNQFLTAAYDGDDVTIWAGDVTFTGSVDGDVISGSVWSYGYLVGEWQIFRALDPLPQPGPTPGPQCGDLPPIYCMGDAEHCVEPLPFDPDIGPGYLEYPLNGETWENQYRSYARRDLIMLVKYAAAKAECKTADWDYWNFAPLGLGDMSEADGSIPGTSIGYPGHPAGTHEYGNDIDTAYYQLYATDNLLRPICSSYDGYIDTGHCVEPPYALDRWRTALFISYISEHPLVRIIYVDWQVGPILDDTLDEMVSLGWIDAEHRAAIPLVYYVEGDEEEEYRFHHHHLHISMNFFYDILSELDLKPNTLNRKSKGKYITGYIELVEGLDVSQIEVSSVALIVDGHTKIPAEAGHAEVADYNGNGIPDLALKFDRQMLIESVDEGTVEIAIIGNIDGMFFQGIDTLRVK